MYSSRLSLWSAFVTSIFVFTAAAPSPNDQVQKDFDQFIDLIADVEWANGRVTSVSAKPDATDEMLIAAALQQLNKNPAPLTEWHILKKQYVDSADFDAALRKRYPNQYPAGTKFGVDGKRYLIAIVDSDQGHKIIAIANPSDKSDSHWARMYNCDANFSSPQDGGTPLIR